ncbi:MAG: sugar transporter ATP-binding protein [Herbinix sp.]|jgi:multiple sugar transport system permease protein|nr:sugar transporter ATP-binding protein [Herbinix sp.]
MKDSTQVMKKNKNGVKLSESIRFRQAITGTIGTVTLLLGSVLVLYPLIWMLSTALKSDAEVMINQSLIPWDWRWDNFAKAWNSAPFDIYLKNTIYLTVIGLIGTLLSNTLVAYGFAKLNFKGKDAIFLCVLGTMMIPGMVTMIPSYVLFSKIGWVGTYLPLTIPAFTGGAYNIFLLRQAFMGINSAYSDAAKIEGAGEMKILTKIYVPLTRPVLTTIAVFTFNGRWNDYFGPMLYLNDEKLYTLQLGLRTFRGTAGVEWQKFMAASLIVLIPTVIIYFFMQKYIIQSVAIGGVKG